jgi:hypothetical protein
MTSCFLSSLSICSLHLSCLVSQSLWSLSRFSNVSLFPVHNFSLFYSLYGILFLCFHALYPSLTMSLRSLSLYLSVAMFSIAIVLCLHALSSMYKRVYPFSSYSEIILIKFQKLSTCSTSLNSEK